MDNVTCEISVQTESREVIDKQVGDPIVLKSKKTQYRVDDFIHETGPPPTKKSITIIKPPKPKKTRDFSCNTTLSFSPIETVIMRTESNSISDFESEDDQYRENEDGNESFDLTTVNQSSDDSESDSDDICFDIPNENCNNIVDCEKFIVFWSCLSTLLNTCIKCASPAGIKRVIKKGTLLIVYMVMIVNGVLSLKLMVWLVVI